MRERAALEEVGRRVDDARAAAEVVRDVAEREERRGERRRRRGSARGVARSALSSRSRDANGASTHASAERERSPRRRRRAGRPQRAEHDREQRRRQPRSLRHPHVEVDEVAGAVVGELDARSARVDAVGAGSRRCARPSRRFGSSAIALDVGAVDADAHRRAAGRARCARRGAPARRGSRLARDEALASLPRAMRAAVEHVARGSARSGRILMSVQPLAGRGNA